MHPRLFDLNEAQALVRNTAPRLRAEDLGAGGRPARPRGALPREQVAELAELGLMGVNVPEQYGGAAAGAVAYALAMMEIAQGCASTAVTMAVNNLVAETIVRSGPRSRRSAMCRRSLRGASSPRASACRRPKPAPMRERFEPPPVATAPST